MAYLVTLPMSDYLIYVLHLMVKKEADVSLPNEHGITPLHNACLRANEGMVILLVMIGANLDLPTVHKECPIHIAARLGKQRIVEALILSGANYQAIGPDGNAEETARRNGHDALAEYIHRLRGADSEKRKKKKKDKKHQHDEQKQAITSESTKRKRHSSTTASTESAPTAGLSQASYATPPKLPTLLQGDDSLTAHAESSEEDAVHNAASPIILVPSAPPSDELTTSSTTPVQTKRPSRRELKEDKRGNDRSAAAAPAETDLTSAEADSSTAHPTVTEIAPTATTETTTETTTAQEKAIDENAASPPQPRKSSAATPPSARAGSVGSTDGAQPTGLHVENGQAGPDGSFPQISLSGSQRHRERSHKINSLMKIFQQPETTSTSPEPALKRTATGIASPGRSASPTAPMTSRSSTPNKRNSPVLSHAGSDGRRDSATPPRPSQSAQDLSTPSANGAASTATNASNTNSTAPATASTAPNSPGATQEVEPEPMPTTTLVASTSAPNASIASVNSDDEHSSSRADASAQVSEVPVNSGRRSPNSIERSTSATEARTAPVPALNLDNAHLSPSKSNGRQAKSARDPKVLVAVKHPPRPREYSHPTPVQAGSSSAASTSEIPEYSSSMPMASAINGGDQSGESGESEDDSHSAALRLSARSLSTTSLTASGEMSSDAKLPSGRRVVDEPLSPPTSARSASKPALDRSASEILTKMSPSQPKQRSQGLIKPLSRMTSSDFGPRSVQRISKSNKVRHSKPFTRFLKDVALDKAVVVPQYPMPSYAVVNISESMIIHNPDFFVEVGKPLMSPTGTAPTLFSEDMEPLTWHYKNNFFDENVLTRSHWNFVAYLELSFHPAPVPIIVSLIQTGPQAVHGLLRSTAGDLTFTLDTGADKKPTALNAKKLIKLLQQQNDAFKTTKFIPVKEPALADELLNFERTEKNQFRSTFSHKVGIVYVKEGQITEEEILANKHGNERFESFLECIGERIDLLDWSGFDGGLDTKKDRTGKRSIFSTWREFEIMFHVSTYIPLGSADEKFVERKKHIANDMTTIIYLDTETTAFKPPTLSGDFLHNFIIVHPLKDGSFTVSVAARKGTPEFGPPIPPGGKFELGSQLKDFLLCKIINAERASQYAPMFLTKRRQARNTLLSMFINKYSPK